MAGAIGNLNVSLSLSSQGLSAGFSKAAAATRQFGKQMQVNLASLSGSASGISSLSTALGTMAGNLGTQALSALSSGIMGVGSAFITANSAFEDAEVALSALTGSVERGASLFAEMKQFATTTPFRLTDITSAGQLMLSFGMSVDAVMPRLREWGDLAAAAPMGATEGLKRVIIAMGQMTGKQRVMSQEMNQLTEAGIPAWQALAEVLGTDVAGAMKKVELGGVHSSNMEKAMANLSGSAKYKGMMEKQSKTFTGQMSNLGDVFDQSAAEIGKPIFNAAKKGLNELNAYLSGPGGKQTIATFKAMFSGLTPAFDKIAEFGRGFLDNIGEVFRKAQILAQPWVDHLRGMGAIIETHLSPVWDKLQSLFSGNIDFSPAIAAFGAFSATMQAGLDMALTAITNVGSAFAWLGEQIGANVDMDAFREGFISTFIGIEYAATHWRETMSASWLAVKLGAVGFYEDVSTIFSNFSEIAFIAGETWAAGLGLMVDSVKIAVNSIGEMFGQMAVRVVDMLKGMWERAKEGNFSTEGLDWNAIIGSPGGAISDAFEKAKNMAKDKTKDLTQGKIDDIFKGRVKSDLEKSLEAELAAINLKGGFDAFSEKRRKEIEEMMNSLRRPGGTDGGAAGGQGAGGGTSAITSPLKAQTSQFASAAIIGTKEAIQAEMKFRADMQGRVKEDVQKAQLQKQKDMAKTLEEIRELLKGTSVEFEFA